MWVSEGKAFVWVERDSGMDMVGERPVHLFEMVPGLGMASLSLPEGFSLLPGETLSAIINMEQDDETLGEGPWIG